jgi:hypothetical protein
MPRPTMIEQDAGSSLYESWTAQRAPQEARIRALWTMTPAQRVAAMYRGELTFPQLCAWAAMRPEEVPLLDGEFWSIAIHSTDSADACESSTGSV